MLSTRPAVAAVALLLGAAGCRATTAAEARSAAASPAPARAGDLQVRTELYFGLSMKDGHELSPEQWADFLRDEVTPRFPKGFTVVDGSGQWQGDGGAMVRERSKILVLLHDDDPASAAKIEAIREAYKRRFAQDSVLRSDQPARVAF